MVNTTTWAQPVGVSNSRHPTEHAGLIADGYDRALVRKTHYRINVNYFGSPVADQNFIIAYKFDIDSQSALPALVASVVTQEIWQDLQASRAWVWRRFAMGQDNTMRSNGVINISVPNVPKHVIMANRRSAIQFTMNDLQSTIADDATGPTIQAFLHIMLLKVEKDGIPSAFVANDVVLSVRCTQTVTVYQRQNVEELIDEGDDG